MTSASWYEKLEQVRHSMHTIIISTNCHVAECLCLQSNRIIVPQKNKTSRFPTKSRGHIQSWPTQQRRIAARSASPESTPATSSSYADTQSFSVREESGALRPAPSQPGIYAFYNKEGQLQYIGLSRKVSAASCTFDHAPFQNFTRKGEALRCYMPL